MYVAQPRLWTNYNREHGPQPYPILSIYKVFTWGHGSTGALGHGVAEDQPTPLLVPGFGREAAAAARDIPESANAQVSARRARLTLTRPRARGCVRMCVM